MKLPHNINRIEAFSDAVFAFAATLMVVNFDLDNDLGLTRSNTVSFLSFFVSFFVLVGLWWLHYNFFRRTTYMDAIILGLNAILLFVVLYYVFPLKNMVRSLLGEGVGSKEDLIHLFIMYGIGFLLIFLCFSLMYYRAYKKSRSLNDSIILYFYSRHFALFVVVGLISILLAYFGVGLHFGFPGFAYFLLAPFCSLHSYQFFKKHQLD